MSDSFKILLSAKGRTYRMQVNKIYSGSELEKYKVTGGSRSLILQCNRPLLINSKSKNAIAWDLLQCDLGASDPKDVAVALSNIIKAIESKIK